MSDHCCVKEDAVKLVDDEPEYFVREGMAEAEYKLLQFCSAVTFYEKALELLKAEMKLSSA